MIKLKRQKSLIWYRFLSLFMILIFAMGAMAQNCGVYAIDPDTRKEVHINSLGYSAEDPGSWHIKKAAEWTRYGTAKVTLDLDTIFKKGENHKKDVILVLDVSGSMYGDKLRRVKEDANDLIDKLINVDTDNRIGLVKFESSATKLMDFSRNQTNLTAAINGLQAGGQTNYYDGLVKAEDIINADNNGNGYQEVFGKDLVILLLTDGCPNEDTNLEVGQYKKLKNLYPNIQISGIQYELGADITPELKHATDRQYVADMSTLHSVLFEAMAVSERYETMQIVDYIDTRYFSLSSAYANWGTVTKEKENSDEYNKVIWNLDKLVTGAGGTLTIYLDLKPGLDPDIIDLPTNTGEDVTVNGSTSTFDKTPILEKYNVHYDANKPGTERGTETKDEMHLPYETVTKSWPSAETCEGWVFKGWEYADPLPEKRVGNDAFTMPEATTYINGTWGKFDISKSMDGEITKELKIATVVDYSDSLGDGHYYTFPGRIRYGALDLERRNHESDYAPFTNLYSFERKDFSDITVTSKEEQIAKTTSMYITQEGELYTETHDYDYDEISYGGHTFEGIEMQTADSPYKVWVWLDEVSDPTTQRIYYATEADLVKFPANANCQYVFDNSYIKVLDLSDFDLSSVNSAYNMFATLTNLETIYVNPDPTRRFNISNINAGYNNNMFYNCSSKLKGQNGTTWSSIYSSTQHCTPQYAVVDGENGQQGLLSIRPDLRN